MARPTSDIGWGFGGQDKHLKEPRVSKKKEAACRNANWEGSKAWRNPEVLRDHKPGRGHKKERERKRQTEEIGRGMDRGQQAPGSCNSSKMPFFHAASPDTA